MSNAQQERFEGQRAFWKLWNSYRRSLAAIAVLLIAVVGLTFGVLGERSAAKARDQSQAQCQADKYIAEAPAGKTPTTLGLHVLAGFRVAYIKAGCTLGPLAPADERVKPFLPKGMR